MDHHTKTTLLAYKASQVLITRCSLPRAIISMCIYVRERERNGGIYSREEGSGSNVCAELIKARIPRSRKPGEVNHSWIMAVLMLASCLALVASALGKWLGLYLQVMHFRIFFLNNAVADPTNSWSRCYWDNQIILYVFGTQGVERLLSSPKSVATTRLLMERLLCRGPGPGKFHFR